MERTGQVCVSPETPISPPPGAGGSEAAAQLAVLAELEQKLWGAVGGALLLVGLISLGCWCCRRKAGNPPHPEQRCAHRPRVRSPHTHPPTPQPGCRPQIPQSPSAPIPPYSPPTWKTPLCPCTPCPTPLFPSDPWLPHWVPLGLEAPLLGCAYGAVPALHPTMPPLSPRHLKHLREHRAPPDPEEQEPPGSSCWKTVHTRGAGPSVEAPQP